MDNCNSQHAYPCSFGNCRAPAQRLQRRESCGAENCVVTVPSESQSSMCEAPLPPAAAGESGRPLSTLAQRELHFTFPRLHPDRDRVRHPRRPAARRHLSG